MIIHDRTGAKTTSDDYLKTLGYEISSVVINTHILGIPQLRERYILIATKNGAFDIESAYLEIDRLKHT